MRVHRISVAALAGLTAATSGAPLAAQPRRALDGTPSADACAELGFKVAPPQQYGRTVGMARAMPGYPPPPPPAPPMVRSAPAIPPLPVPPVERRVGEPAPPAAPPGAAESVVVTASRYQPFPTQPRDTERYPNAVANPIRQTASDPVSTFSVDVDTAAYANVRRFLNDGVRPPTDAVRVEEMVNYFDYGYAPPRDRATPFTSYVSLAPSPGRRSARSCTSASRVSPCQRPSNRR